MRERWEHVMNIDHNLQSALGRDITRDARSLDELALSPDGSTLVALRFGAISVWNTRDGSLVDSLLEPLATLSLNRLTPFVRGGTSSA
jgi:hypothetical protein